MTTRSIQFDDANDSLYILPLSIIPLTINSLKKARLTKNTRLDSVIELFADQTAGKGQILPEQLADVFDFSGEKEKDFDMILALSELASFDVYSLRTSLRELGIDVDQEDCLKLSNDMESGLSSYMGAFTGPLINRIYGNQSGEKCSFSDLLKLFANPDAAVARKNLVDLAAKLEVDLPEIPKFLTRYADVYLSLAYYKYCLDLVTPALSEFLNVLNELRLDQVHNKNPELMRACKRIEGRLTGAEDNISKILDTFQSNTEDMWKNISGPGFRAIEETIQNYQREIGGSICALTIKMNGWQELKRKTHMPTQVAFIMSDMLRGIERVTRTSF